MIYETMMVALEHWEKAANVRYEECVVVISLGS